MSRLPTDFTGFCRAVLAEIGMPDPPSVEPDTHLGRDLLLDSIMIYELVVVVEDLGVFLPSAALEDMDTLGDLHTAFLAARGG
jgi:acyl carrier protein